MTKNKSSISQAQSYEAIGEFWDTHDLGDYWPETYPVEFEIEPLKNLLHPKLITLSQEPVHCPRCHQNLMSVMINYVAWQQGNLLIIRDVPAFRCQGIGHEYILEETLDQIESLLTLEHPQPIEIVQTPVFSLKRFAGLNP